MRLELSRKAQADLDALRDHSVEHFGVVRAVAYLNAIEQTFRRVLSFPEIGSAHPTVQPVVRSLACQRHRIFYSVAGKTVMIVRILHEAMDAEQQLQGR